MIEYYLEIRVRLLLYVYARVNYYDVKSIGVGQQRS